MPKAFYSQLTVLVAFVLGATVSVFTHGEVRVWEVAIPILLVGILAQVRG